LIKNIEKLEDIIKEAFKRMRGFLAKGLQIFIEGYQAKKRLAVL